MKMSIGSCSLRTRFTATLTFVTLVAASCVQSVTAQSMQSAITNADITRYVKIGLPENVIINLIGEAQSAGVCNSISQRAPSLIWRTGASHPPSSP